MSVSRRHAVKMAGMGAASLSLSCGTTSGAFTDRDVPETKGGSESDDPMVHKLVIRNCGQYVVVEVKESSEHSYRGRLEVVRGDTVKISNQTGGNVRLIFPTMRGMPSHGDVEVVGDLGDTCEKKPLAAIPGLAVFGLNAGGCFSFTVADTVELGRYEYVVLFETKQLERPYKGAEGGFVSTWSHATGGSSSEFIIRRRR